MTSDDEQLLRSVRARIARIAGVSEVERRGEIALVHSGVELARIVLRTPPRLIISDEPHEITGLPQAAAAAGKVLALAVERAAQAPQLDLFGTRR